MYKKTLNRKTKEYLMEECIICFEENTDFVTFPCDHKVCVLCYPKLKRCPLCNRELTETTEIQERQESPFYYDLIIRMICYIMVVLLFLLSIPRFE
jgi:hypothetical protein